MLNPGQVEDNILLKLPPDLAVIFRAKLKNKSLSKFAIIPDENSVDHQKIIRKFSIEIEDFPALKGTLVDLPCIIELQKTREKDFYYKTGDVAQLLVVELEDDSTPTREKLDFAKNPAGLDRLNYQVDSGITPPSYGCRKRWDLERQVCVCEDQEGEICSVCGALPKKRVQVASKKLLNMMIARPTESFRIDNKDIDQSQSMVRVVNSMTTPASLSVRQTPMLSRTPGAKPSPQIDARKSLPHQPSNQNTHLPSNPVPGMPKPKLQKLVQKTKANTKHHAHTRAMIETYRQHQIKLAQKQQELNTARRRTDITPEQKANYEQLYQTCIKKGFQLKSKIFELEKSLQ